MSRRAQSGDSATLFLAGDVMTGRGIDQVLAHPSDPRLDEAYAKTATDYVALAERANGPIPRPVDYRYVWGDALAALDRYRPDVRLVNLETSVTTSSRAEPKGINYRMHPRNLPVITAAGVDCCCLANNHVLDWGRSGLIETLESLHAAGVATPGAGRDADDAASPAILPVPAGRILVFAFGVPTSGIPSSWAATPDTPGVNLLDDLGPAAVGAISSQVAVVKQPGDVAVASLHWGGNWGYQIRERQRRFAHDLIDSAGIDVVFGHSSHHPKAIEVHRGRLVLYGCGDFINDYEGIHGLEEYRGDLVLMYLPVIRMVDGTLIRLVMVPFRIRNFRLHRAIRSDAEWLSTVLTREGARFGTTVTPGEHDVLTLEWA